MAQQPRQTRHRSCHGARVPRGLDAPDAGHPGQGRFGRMFASLPYRELSAEASEDLFEHLVTRSDVAFTTFNSEIPAGYTYVGQFIDHDMTFDPASSLQQANDPAALVNFRTPRLDLDSVYGSGPADQPFLYQWTGVDSAIKLLVDRLTDDRFGAYCDLPRNSQDRALIGDPRNDEHLIIAQLHLLFIQFHNAVVDHLRACGQLTGPELFEEAQRLVRWHYQWIVTHDFLEKVVGERMAASVLRPGDHEPTVERRHFRWEGSPYMPVEFSGAAYRFGHSMVRSSYPMNDHADKPIFRLPAGGEHLGGFRRLPGKFVIDWSFFFDLDDPRVLLLLPKESLSIDTHVSRRLFHLPTGVGAEGVEALPMLNLRRAAVLRLPAGPDVACAIGHEPLTAAQLELDQIESVPVQAELLGAAPLWYYVLCEARALADGERLGPVGGRIVAEVLVGLLEGDPSSYLRQRPSWTPELPGSDGDFTMADLVRFTHPEYRFG